jgi:hypothetical protein
MSYIYQADIYCDDCGRDIKEDCEKFFKKQREEKKKGIDFYEDREDSDSYPQYVNNDESDCPQHCGNHSACSNYIQLSDGSRIGCFLENSLTTDGEEYVRNAHDERHSEVTEMWMNYYDLKGKKEEISEKILNSYENWVCPDCLLPIPEDIQEGESCVDCGHVFCIERESDE